MNLDDFKHRWQQEHREQAKQPINDLAAEAVTHADKLEATLKRRDWIETAAALFVIVFFGATLLPSWAPVVMKVGAVIIVLDCVGVIALLYWARRGNTKPTRNLPLAAFCEAEIHRIDSQIWLLRHVNWWYTGPLMVGVFVFLYGIVASVPRLPPQYMYVFLAGVAVCLLAVMAIIYRMNQRAVVNELLPVRWGLNEVLKTLQDTAAG